MSNFICEGITQPTSSDQPAVLEEVVLAFIEHQIKQACATDQFETRDKVLSFALRMTFGVTLIADTLNFVAHHLLDALKLLPYAVGPAVAVGLIISTVVASSLTFTIVYFVGLAIHHLSISRTAFEHLSRTDMLSGLLNRRAFMEEVANMQDHASLVLFDIDRFKRINDEFGHDAGDHAIIAVARHLMSAFTKPHIVARIGGEEFAILVVKVTAPERLALAQRCREMMAVRPVQIKDKLVHITLSGGIADKESHASFEEMFNACDRALYIAKSTGRNQLLHSRDAISDY